MEEGFSKTGGCACGEVRYEITDKPIITHACHCTDCQRTSGSAFAILSLIMDKTIKIEGETSKTTLSTGSGAGHEPHFCSTCGTTLWHIYKNAPPGVLVLATTTLDEARDFEPAAHIWTKSTLSWVTLPEDVPCFEEFYDPSILWPFDNL